jgi:putative transposase
MVAIEDLHVRNMSKSVKDNIKKAGRNVAQKSGRNKSILDQGWGRQLDYKLNWSGGMLVPVPPHYTSQTCPACGHLAKENRQIQARFECMYCGHTDNADVVDAMNILARGHRVAACGEECSGHARKRKNKPASVKQEPTEVTVREVTHV